MKIVKLFHKDDIPSEFVLTLNEYLADRRVYCDDVALPWTIGEGTEAYIEMCQIRYGNSEQQNSDGLGFWDLYEGKYPELDDWFMTQGINAGETVFIIWRERDLWWRLP